MAQQKPFQIGWLSPHASPDVQLLGEFKRGMSDHGLIEGQGYNIVFSALPMPGGDQNYLQKRAESLVERKVDLIVSSATPATLAAKAATSTIPIVMVAVGNPEKTRILTKRAGNITGLTTLLPQTRTRRLELLKEAVSTISRVAVLLDPDNAANNLDWVQTHGAAAGLGLQVKRFVVRDRVDFDPVFEAVQGWKANGLLTIVAPLTIIHRNVIVDFAAAHHLPAMYGLPEFVEAGGLMAYGPCFPEMYRSAATFVQAILIAKRKPSDLPVGRPPEFELTFNPSAAQALGPVIPSTVRFQSLGSSIDMTPKTASPGVIPSIVRFRFPVGSVLP